MNIFKSAASLLVLAQATSFVASAALAQQAAPPAPASQSASVVHGAVAAIQERLAEADATVSLFEQNAAQLQGAAREKALAALQSLRARRDAYRELAKAAVADVSTWTETQTTELQKRLDDDWSAYQSARDDYLEAAKADLATREATLNVELDANRQSWRSAIEDLRVRARTLSADQQAAVEKRIAALKAEADEVKARIGRLQAASSEAWQKAQQGVADARKIFDESYGSIRKTIEDAAK